MRSKVFLVWPAVRWLLLMFFFAQAMEAPAVLPPGPHKAPLSVWTGVSSWYGEKFHGRVTASGELFDMNALTAAHRTLPLGSFVRVVNPANGRSRIVRITDRGPIFPRREIDVSRAVARELGFEQAGLAQLRIELLEVPERRAAKPPRSPHRRAGS